MKLRISKEEDHFLVDDPTIPGSPPVGRGRTMLEAIGSWFHRNQDKMNLSFDVDESAQPAEMARRQRELARR
jgi:hypothetical protein